MLSNNMRRAFNGRVLAAVLVGVVAGAVVLGLMSSATGKAQAGGGQQVNTHSAEGLSLNLHFVKGPNKSLVFTGCNAIEAAGTMRNCGPEGKGIKREHSAQAAITWNGQDGGSGCVIVGGVEFCF